MKNFLNWFKSEESGQGMVEYALIIALIAIVLIVALNGVGGAIDDVLQKAEDALDSVAA